MSAQSRSAAKAKAYVRLLQNPYASLSMELPFSENSPSEPTEKQKHAFLHKLQNPYASLAIFGDPDEGPAVAPVPALSSGRVSNECPISRSDLEKSLDEVLQLYKPYVARADWARVTTYRDEFLQEAVRTPLVARQVVERLHRLSFTVAPGEKVEYNRAPAEKMISALKRLLAQ